MKEPRLENKLVMESGVPMTNFCWTYTNAHLEKLFSLREENEIFRAGIVEAEESVVRNGNSSEITSIAYCAIECIVEQIKYPGFVGQNMTPDDVGHLIETCKEFLDIFLKK